MLFHLQTGQDTSHEINCWQGNDAGAPGMGQQVSLPAVSPQACDTITVAAVKTNAIVPGQLRGMDVEIMLDSGSSVSLIRQKSIAGCGEGPARERSTCNWLLPLVKLYR